MISGFIRRVAFVAALAVPVVAGVAPAAQADGRFGFSISVSENGVHVAGGPRRDYGRHHRGGPRWHRGGRGCQPGLALRKARELGMRHARVVRANGRVIKVAGHSRYGHARANFAQARGCPLISYRR